MGFCIPCLAIYYFVTFADAPYGHKAFKPPNAVVYRGVLGIDRCSSSEGH